MPTSSKPIETPLEFPWNAPPESGKAIEVASGVHWIRMPLPFALDHINLWILDDGDGLALVDSGFNSADTKEIWSALLTSVFADRKPTRLLCTHHHPDHMGLAEWLTQTYRIALSTTQKEWDAFHQWSRLEPAMLTDIMQTFYVCGGVSEERREADFKRRQKMTSWTRSDLTAFKRLRADDVVDIGGQAWSVTIGTGHAPELAALYRADDKVLISGDQVLPKISPNVSVMPFALDANPLKDFMDSLDRFRALPSDTLVLPSHKLPFYGLHDRIDALKSHHMDRLDDSLEACATSVTAATATTVLFPRALNDHQYFFALGETLAHLNYLWHDGQVSRDVSESGAYTFHLS